MTQFLGIVDVIVDGLTLLSGDDATLDPGGVTRTVVKGSKVHGFREEVREAKLEVSVAIDSSFSIDTYRNTTAATCNFQADTGQTWSMQNAWCSDPPQISQKDGKAKITFTSPPAEEILS
jgi:hypothetical protein